MWCRASARHAWRRLSEAPTTTGESTAGRSGSELLVALAELVVVGGDHLLHLDELREDVAGAELRAVGEVPAPTTAGQTSGRPERPGPRQRNESASRPGGCAVAEWLVEHPERQPPLACRPDASEHLLRPLL